MTKLLSTTKTTAATKAKTKTTKTAEKTKAAEKTAATKIAETKIKARTQAGAYACLENKKDFSRLLSGIYNGKGTTDSFGQLAKSQKARLLTFGADKSATGKRIDGARYLQRVAAGQYDWPINLPEEFLITAHNAGIIKATEKGIEILPRQKA